MKRLVLSLSIATLAAACGPQAAPAPTAIVEITRSQNPIKLIGEGRLSHPAELIELSMTVVAECFDTPLAASDAADEAVAKLLEKLRTRLDSSNSKDGVFSHGGFTEPFSRYAHGTTTCDGTFGKTTRVVMKTTRVDRFASDFAEIQREVLGGSLRKPTNPRADTSIVYAVLGTPQPQLLYETRERLEQEALADALDNARAKLKATAKAACGMSSPRLIKFEESSASVGRPIPYGASSPAVAEDGSPIELDAIWINKTLDVYFAVEPGPC